MRVLRALTALTLLGLVGCEPGLVEPGRGPLSGTVTLDGKPVASGQVRFIALDTDGVNVLAPITGGKFDLAADQGPAKGKYRVEFSVPSATKTRTPNPDIPGEWLEEAAETLPPRYHRDSSITLEYDPANPRPVEYKLTR
jgi:hypothetical protein